MRDVKRRVQALLTGLPGVISAVELRREDIDTILKIEESLDTAQLILVKKLGIQEVSKRDYVFVILKDTHFRCPPAPTVYMVEDMNITDKSNEHVLEVAGKRYYIVGEEVFDSGKVFQEKTSVLSSGFVLFPDRRRGHGKKPAYFIIPPIPFYELEEKRETWGIERIMSVSPSSTTDKYIRDSYRLKREPKYATVLVGFDEIH